jgi:hypothetical protein
MPPASSPGQRAATRDHIIARQAEPVGEHQPALDAAGLVAEPVVVMDAVNPLAAQFAIMGAAHEGGVLARHSLLIAIAVQSPGAHLILVQLAAVQQLMERMLVVIALGADGADRGLEILPGQRSFVEKGVRFDDVVHRATSIPSSPISQPAALASARSLELASSTGFELLICT